MNCLHRFPSDLPIEFEDSFNDPFRYRPHPIIAAAAEEVLKMVPESDFRQGKMLGVLAVETPDGTKGYLAAFSGSVNDKNIIDGFVPPIYDLLDPEGGFKKGEAELNRLNSQIRQLEESQELKDMRAALKAAQENAEAEISEMKSRMALAKKEREAIREAGVDQEQQQALIRQSQFQKAELRRLKLSWEERICRIKEGISSIDEEIKALKSARAEKSEKLQKWIFDMFVVTNALGEKSSLTDIFTSCGQTPPGGTGECAAPKLLQYAYTNGLRPLAMGEFWYGQSPDGPVRTHGHFYPSCTSKCGPLLKYMMKGLKVETALTACGKPSVIYEDNEIIIASKPSGMPSVPGLDGSTSLLEWLQRDYGMSVQSVHRLDMDTSGIMVYAKTEGAAADLRRQFEKHTVRKTYLARLSPPDSHIEKSTVLTEGLKGSISLPLSADYDERPRQKADTVQGKESLTEYEVVRTYGNGTTDILFHPVTGRTHQLRVHSAHIHGLARPIVGDLLYGGEPNSRLCLHAMEITFRHPGGGEEVTFSENISF